jgi:hypothetical protein
MYHSQMTAAQVQVDGNISVEYREKYDKLKVITKDHYHNLNLQETPKAGSPMHV